MEELVQQDVFGVGDRPANDTAKIGDEVRFALMFHDLAIILPFDVDIGELTLRLAHAKGEKPLKLICGTRGTEDEMPLPEPVDIVEQGKFSVILEIGPEDGGAPGSLISMMQQDDAHVPEQTCHLGCVMERLAQACGSGFEGGVTSGAVIRDKDTQNGREAKQRTVHWLVHDHLAHELKAELPESRTQLPLGGVFSDVEINGRRRTPSIVGRFGTLSLLGVLGAARTARSERDVGVVLARGEELPDLR